MLMSYALVVCDFKIDKMVDSPDSERTVVVVVNNEEYRQDTEDRIHPSHNRFVPVKGSS